MVKAIGVFACFCMGEDYRRCPKKYSAKYAGTVSVVSDCVTARFFVYSIHGKRPG